MNPLLVIQCRLDILKNHILTLLARVAIGMKRQHDHNNSYKGKHLIGHGYQVQKHSPLLLWQEAWWCVGKHGIGEGTYSSASKSTVSRKRG